MCRSPSAAVHLVREKQPREAVQRRKKAVAGADRHFCLCTYLRTPDAELDAEQPALLGSIVRTKTKGSGRIWMSLGLWEETPAARYSSWTAPARPSLLGSWGGPAFGTSRCFFFTYEKKRQSDRDGAGRRISHHHPTTSHERASSQGGRMIRSSLGLKKARLGSGSIHESDRAFVPSCAIE